MEPNAGDQDSAKPGLLPADRDKLTEIKPALIAFNPPRFYLFSSASSLAYMKSGSSAYAQKKDSFLCTFWIVSN